MVSLISATELDWPIVVGQCGDEGPEGASADQWRQAQAIAVAWLWALSGRQLGHWTVTYRPERTAPARHGCGDWMLSRWYGLSAATAQPSALRMPGPVDAVTEVRIDGAVLASTVWLVQGDQLLRVDGQPWPASQDTTKPVTAAGTWQITYVRGRDVPVGGQVAAGVLACEIAAALIGDENCRLPANTQTVARNGVTVNLDALELQMGYTGLPQVDEWIRTVNPDRVQRPSTVWTPDLDPVALARGVQ